MAVAKMWADAQANAQKALGKDGKLPKMSVDLESLVKDTNKALDDLKPAIQSVGDAWHNATTKIDDVGKGCDTLAKSIGGDDFGLDSKDKDQAKKQKEAKAILTNALTNIKGVIFSKKQENAQWLQTQIQKAMK